MFLKQNFVYTFKSHLCVYRLFLFFIAIKTTQDEEENYIQYLIAQIETLTPPQPINGIFESVLNKYSPFSKFYINKLMKEFELDCNICKNQTENLLIKKIKEEILSVWIFLYIRIYYYKKKYCIIDFVDAEDNIESISKAFEDYLFTYLNIIQKKAETTEPKEVSAKLKGYLKANEALQENDSNQEYNRDMILKLASSNFLLLLCSIIKNINQKHILAFILNLFIVDFIGSFYNILLHEFLLELICRPDIEKKYWFKYKTQLVKDYNLVLSHHIVDNRQMDYIIDGFISNSVKIIDIREHLNKSTMYLRKPFINFMLRLNKLFKNYITYRISDENFTINDAILKILKESLYSSNIFEHNKFCNVYYHSILTLDVKEDTMDHEKDLIIKFYLYFLHNCGLDTNIDTSLKEIGDITKIYYDLLYSCGGLLEHIICDETKREKYTIFLHEYIDIII